MSKVRSISGLESHVGYWLRFVSNHVSHAFRVRVESTGVTVAEWVVLRAVFGEEGLHPSQIAHRLGMTRGAISKLLARLVDKKLVGCIDEKGDRRYQSVVLTETGRRLVPRLAKLADENDAAFFNILSASERETLLKTLEKLVHENGIIQVPVE